MKTTLIPSRIPPSNRKRARATIASFLLALSATAAVPPPVVVRTVPEAGAEAVDPTLSEIRVTYSRPMMAGSWSWSTWGEENFPKTTGDPRYLEDQKTCVLPVRLEPGRFYALWLNSDQFKNFKDTDQIPAVPYLLSFRTRPDGTPPAPPSPPTPAPNPAPTPIPSATLNADQQTVLDWTDRQFRGFFDGRTFDGWSTEERSNLEKRSVDTLNGPLNRDYYQAIGTLAALRATNALPTLRTIALDRRDKDNRDRWMAIRALGMIGDRASIPELVHLVYHGNSNTRWWAQISLVRLTGQNFGSDWEAWGRWWNDKQESPRFTPEIVRWWNGQAENDKLAASLAEQDRKFLEGIRR